MTELIIKCSTEKSEMKKKIIDRTTLIEIEGKFSFNQEREGERLSFQLSERAFMIPGLVYHK